ncbi:MAG: Calcium-binding EF-hand-containing protein, partial [Pedosphaera sp.]|nr:Calcium-binding EF-hand-containing protein [Pedosphaera sp.]
GRMPAHWDARAEAESYWEEARWMFKWRMFQEAKRASEASWALGRQTHETAGLRIKAYLECAGNPGLCAVQDHYVIYGRPFKQGVQAWSEIASFASVPEPGKFTDMIRAAELLMEDSRRLANDNQKADPAWVGIAVKTLQQCSSWLRYYYFTAEARAGQDEALPRARELCRQMAEILRQIPASSVGDDKQAFLTTQAEHLAFWSDGPEETLRGYRMLMDSGQWPLIRNRFFNAAYKDLSMKRFHEGGYSWSENVEPSARVGLSNPCLTGWDWETRRRCPALWSGFIDELCNTPKPWIRLEGLMLRCSYSWSGEDFERNLTQLLDFSKAQLDAVATVGLDEKLVADLQTLVDWQVNNLTNPARDRVRNELWGNFKREFSQSVTQRKQLAGRLKEDHDAVVRMTEKEKYLQTQTNFDFMSFDRLFQHDTYAAAEANALLPLLTNYQARIDSVVLGDGREHIKERVQREQARFWIGRLDQQLRAAISNPPPSQANSVVAGQVTRPVQPSPNLLPGGVNPARPSNPLLNNSPDIGRLSIPGLATAANTLEAGRFWRIPAAQDGAVPRMVAYPNIASCCFRDGRLWLEVMPDRAGMSGHADFFAVNLANFAAGKIEFQGEQFSLMNLNGSRRFDVDDQYLYLSLKDSVRRYSFRKHEWEQFTLAGSGRPMRLGPRLFFVNANSILEYYSNGSIQVLASSRRRPAMNLLDSVENYDPGHLFLDAQGGINVCAGSEIYVLPTPSGDWQHLASLPAVSWEEFRLFEDGFIVGNGRGETAEWWGMGGSSGKPELLFRPTVPTGFGAPPPRTSMAALPHWQIQAPSADFCRDKDGLWFLVENSGRSSPSGPGRPLAQGESRQPVMLIRFKFDEPDPIAIPVHFAAPDSSPLQSGAVGRRMGMPPVPGWHQWILESTPAGLIAVHGLTPGFWLIPKAGLDHALASVYAQQATRKTDAVAH